MCDGVLSCQVPDNLKGHLAACLSDLSERVADIRMPKDDDGDEAAAEAATDAAVAAVEEGGELARKVMRTFGMGSLVDAVTVVRGEEPLHGGDGEEVEEEEEERSAWSLATAVAAARAAAAAAASAAAAAAALAAASSDASSGAGDEIATEGAHALEPVMPNESVIVSRSPGVEFAGTVNGELLESTLAPGDTVPWAREGVEEQHDVPLEARGERAGRVQQKEEQVEEEEPLYRAKRLLAMLQEPSI